MTQKRLKIVLVADYSGNKDEGMKNTATNLYALLSKTHQVIPLNVNNVLSRRFLKELSNIKPDIIHYVPGPTIISFLITKWLKINCRASRTVMSATHPGFFGWKGLFYSPTYATSSIFQSLIPLLKPDLLFVQAVDTEKIFKSLGCHTRFLPSGVDINKFTPVSLQTKIKLREKYQFPLDRLIILHVGSAGMWRNVKTLSFLQSNENQVIMVAGTTSAQDYDTLTRLKEAGCIVIKDYISNIEEIYQLSDCFVFPTTDRRGCIEFPLSVLEAMACNLPVITTRFGALPRVFRSNTDFIFINNTTELKDTVNKLKFSPNITANRDIALSFSWENIVNIIETGYFEILS